MSIDGFLPYYRNIRERTMRVVEVIRPDKIDWAYRDGKWTIGDILRHVAAIERHMWPETIQGNQPRFTYQMHHACGSPGEEMEMAPRVV